mgnify:FL=1|tara:strand:- start:451 stop:615 length:165 start_codon:yes stop_codon:yes gene_type:complete
MTDETKQVADVAAGGVTISAVMAWIPEATALLSLVWVCIRIYETETVKKVIGKE